MICHRSSCFSPNSCQYITLSFESEALDFMAYILLTSLKILCFRFIYSSICIWMFYLLVCMYATCCLVTTQISQRYGIARTGVTDTFEPVYGSWKPNSGPLQEHPVGFLLSHLSASCTFCDSHLINMDYLIWRIS